LNKSNMHQYFLGGLLFLTPLLFIFQGLDFTDMGYVLASSRDIISSPDRIYPGIFSTFLSMFINGLWMKLSASWGLLGARFGAVLLYWCIFVVLIKTLSRYVPLQRIFVWLLLLFLLTQRGLWISYNTVTALLAVFSLCALQEGYVANKRWLFLLSGAFCACAFFARFPNILMITFGLLPLLPSFANAPQNPWRQSFRNSTLFFAGYFGAFGSVLFAMWRSGYLDSFLQGMLIVRWAATNSSHSLNVLLGLFVKHHIAVLGLAVPLLVLGAATAFLIGCMSKWFQIVSLSVCTGVFFILGWIFYDYWPVLLYGLIGVVYLYLLMKMWLSLYWKDVESLLLYAAAFFMLVTVPLGGGSGITNARYALWFAFPLFFEDIASLKNLGFAFGWQGLFQGKESRSAFWFKRLAIVGVIMLALASCYRYTYRDTSDRLAMRYSIDHPMLRGIYTTKERAQVVQELLNELEKHVSPGDVLLGYRTATTLYYLTETIPYLYNPWPFLYQPEQLKYYLKKAESEHLSLPVVARSKYSLRAFEWPLEYRVEDSDNFQENWDVLEDFLTRHAYEKTWENNTFEVWLPSMVDSTILK